jgi:alanyl-tRNA synthetase
MNQFVPIFLGQVQCPYSPPRAADTQKCIRAGGKHNDLEDVGLDTYHHTFFEMLGNWSFGDYFKNEAIDWAWELITGVWKFPANRLYATVYSPDKSKNDPSTFDQEAWDRWAGHFRAAGLDPAVHIVPGNKKDNFWMMGDTGPCGPCSELHVDLTPAGDTKGSLVNQGDARCIEIWNLVFIQFNANPDGSFSPLPAKHVDTGMGFERVTSIIQGTKNFSDFANAKISNYETDIFRPIFDELEKLSGLTYHSTLPGDELKTANCKPETIRQDIAFRVIADHLRTLSFAIADGILPGNNDRHYVLRRILRRAVRYGRTLGFHEPFFYKLADVLAATMGDTFPEIRTKLDSVKSVLKQEEEAFTKTLDNGVRFFESEVSFQQDWPNKRISGAVAFKLYDTFGFPLDLTELMARERGLTVDVAGFNALMEEQRARARAAQKKTVIELSQIETKSPTHFLGFDHDHIGADVQEVVTVKDQTVVVLNNSVLYAEMGGQVGDSGELLSTSAAPWRVRNTQKSGDTFLHFLDGPDAPAVGSHVTVRFDQPRRSAIERHHTVTHLLHWALHEIVSRDATQKGSSVTPDKLTFDFNSAALTPAQIAAVEKLVNQRIAENAPVTWANFKYADVKSRPDIMQFFGDKYGDFVRVVQIGGSSSPDAHHHSIPKLDGYSMELCGGTHVRNTGDIGLFKILHEGAVAAGVRRIEAVAGESAHAAVQSLVQIARDLEKSLADAGAPVPVPSPAVQNLLAAFSSSSSQLETRNSKLETSIESVHALEQYLHHLKQQLADHKAAAIKQQRAAQQKNAAALADELAARAVAQGPLHFLVAEVDLPSSALRDLAVQLSKKIGPGLVVLGTAAEGKVGIAALCSPEAVAAGHNAGQIVGTLCAQLGGKGGGKPEFAQGGGKDPTQLSTVLTAFQKSLA